MTLEDDDLFFLWSVGGQFSKRNVIGSKQIPLVDCRAQNFVRF